METKRRRCFEESKKNSSSSQTQENKFFFTRDKYYSLFPSLSSKRLNVVCVLRSKEEKRILFLLHQNPGEKEKKRRRRSLFPKNHPIEIKEQITSSSFSSSKRTTPGSWFMREEIDSSVKSFLKRLGFFSSFSSFSGQETEERVYKEEE